MKPLKKILKNVNYNEIKGPKDIEISNIAINSKSVAPGNLFIAKKGNKFDATKFIYDAVSNGAKAVLTDIYDPFLKNITQIITEDIQKASFQIAANFFDNPSKDLKVIAATGTNGKTTICYLIKHILDTLNKKTSLLSTIEYLIGDNKLPSTLTTPDNVNIQKFFKEMLNHNTEYVCLEASSHGLEQGRLNNIFFDIAIFTNITLDHLDYHKSFENYKIAKKRLFDVLTDKDLAIVNIDDDNHKFMINDTPAKVQTYSINKKADFSALNIKTSLKGTFFDLMHDGKICNFFLPLIGKHNVLNALAAIAATKRLNNNIEDIAQALKEFKGVRGRLEKIKSTHKNIFIDFAHTPDALKNVLTTLKDINKEKLITVFGCGGKRDIEKRPQMAEISEKFSDISIVTSDNPREEDPLQIIKDIEKGFSKEAKYFSIPDRKKAIKKAISLAKSNDIVIITGKGHETYQILNNAIINFDDKAVCEDLLKEPVLL